MTTPAPDDLLSRLRMVDELYAKAEPEPALEVRLRARLRGLVEKPAPVSFSTSLWGSWRPIAIAIAATSVFFLSMQDDDMPRARSGLVLPKAIESTAETIEAPIGERVEETNPRLGEPQSVPLPSAPDPRSPAPPHSWLAPDPSSPFTSDPERKTLHGARGPMMDAPSLSRMNTPSGSADESEGLLYWSPSQDLPRETRASTFGGAGGPRSTNAGSPKPTAPSEPPAPQASCATPETWKGRAVLDCEESGLVLAEIVCLDPCGEGLFQSAEYDCAEPDSEGDTCMTDTLGDGVTCNDPGVLKDLANETCKLSGLEMVDFTYTTDDCGWMTRQASFTCCPVVPVPEPPLPPAAPVCKPGALGDGVTCVDNATLEQNAVAACGESGLVLSEIQVSGDCPAGQGSTVGFTCCVP